MRVVSRLSLILVVVVACTTAVRGSSPQAPTREGTSQRSPAAAVQLTSVQPLRPPSAAGRYRVRQGDSLELIFPFVPAFNQTVAVQPDGYIALRLVGELQVEGQTVPELETVLRTRYASILRDPVITIAVRDFEKPYFIALGEVERPGKYELRGETTVAQALAIAGGFKEKAKRSRVLVFQGPGGDGPGVRELDMKHVLTQGRLEGDIRLNSGDMVFVSKSRVPSASAFYPVLSVLPWLLRPY